MTYIDFLFIRSNVKNYIININYVYILIGIAEDMTHIYCVFTSSKVSVTRVNFVKNVKRH